MKKRKAIIENLSLMGMLKWMNETYKVKKTGNPFSISDIQGYIMRNSLPSYLGGHIIEVVENKYATRRYNIIKNDNL